MDELQTYVGHIEGAGEDIYREMKLDGSMEELQTTVDHTEGAGVVGI